MNFLKSLLLCFLFFGLGNFKAQEENNIKSVFISKNILLLESNYRLNSKKINFESYNTVGSYNLLSSFNAIGGKIGKLKYYAYFTKKSREGYRRNEHTDYDAQSIILNYDVTTKLSIRTEWAGLTFSFFPMLVAKPPNGLRYLRWGGDGEAVQPEKG